MRQKIIPYIRLPKRLIVKENPYLEATFYAKKYNKSNNIIDRYKILYGLMENARSWDIISRSCLYYKIFEKLTHKSFEEFWNKEVGWPKIKHMEETILNKGGG